VKNCLLMCAIAFGFSFSAYSQLRENKDVSVHLEAERTVVRKTDSIKFRYIVQNNGRETLYLVMYEEYPLQSYDPNSNELSLSFWYYPINYHIYNFPELKKIKPKRRLTLNVTVPIMPKWRHTKPGKWSVDACVGLLSAKDLKGRNLKAEYPIDLESLLKLQQEACSGSIQIEIIE
jgi:hypothetical protein